MGLADFRALLRYGRRGIVIRLMGVALFLGMLGVLGRLVILQPVLRHDVLGLSADHQHAIAGYVARDIEERLQQRLRFLGRLAGALPRMLLVDPAAAKAWLDERAALMPLFPDGLRLLRVDGDPALAPEWARRALAAQAPVIGRPQRGEDGIARLTMAVAIREPGRAPMVLAGTTRLDAPGFLDLIAQQRVGRSGGFLLVDPQDQIFVAASDPAKTLQPLPAPGVNPLHDRAMAGYRGTGQTINIDGMREVSAMESVPVAGWFVVARLPLTEAEAPLRSLHAVMVAGGLLLPVAIFLVMGAVLPPMFRPLTEAARHMHAMAHGHAPIAPLPVVFRDEIGELTEGFNFLLARLRRKEDALRESEARMAHLAQHDPLTGLANRALLEERLDQALSRAQAEGGQVHLLYIDLDRFKPINDTLGHDVGDEVLRQAAQRLAAQLRATDMAARVGGDEFVILVEEDAGQPADGAAIAARCQAALAAPFAVAEHELSLGASIGLSCYPENGQTQGDLMRHADQSMYRSKQAGRRGAV